MCVLSLVLYKCFVVAVNTSQKHPVPPSFNKWNYLFSKCLTWVLNKKKNTHRIQGGNERSLGHAEEEWLHCCNNHLDEDLPKLKVIKIWRCWISWHVIHVCMHLFAVGLQSCPLSQILFIIFMDRIFSCIQGGGLGISFLHFPDDAFLLASSDRDL